MNNLDEKPVIIFLDYFEKPERVASLIKKIRKEEKHKIVVVSLNFVTDSLIQSTGLEIIYFDELLSKEDYEFMERYVFGLTQTWYKKLKAVYKVTEYNEILFGELTQYDAQFIFPSIIKRLEITLKIVENFHPRKIILIGDDDIFPGLSAFINKELSIRSLFIKISEKEPSFKRIIRQTRTFLAEAISTVYDYSAKKALLKEKNDNRIFVDTRLYFELKDLEKEYCPCLYLLEKGLRIRQQLIRGGKKSFAPILTEDFLRVPKAFSSFYRYWRYIQKEDSSFRNAFIYKDLKIWKILELSIKELIIYDFPLIKKNLIFLEKLYANLKPRIVILREAVRMPEKTIVFAARRADIPTLVVQHGMLVAKATYTELHCDKIAVWGKAAIDYYSVHGRDTSKCVITGKPKHDLIYLGSKNSRKEEFVKILRDIGADPNKQTILYLPAHFKAGRHDNDVYFSPDNEYIALQSILEIAKCFSCKQFIIKMHPFDLIGPQELSNLVKDCKNIFIVKNVDVINLIENSTLIITSLFSSASIDAIILGKPLITLNLYKREDLAPFAQRGVAIGITESRQLSEAVKQVFEDKKVADWLDSNRENFICDYAYKVDGKSTERLMNLIKTLCNGSKFPETRSVISKKENLSARRNENESIINKSSL